MYTISFKLHDHFLLQMEKFKLSDKQSQAILDMRLQRLTGLERKKIEDEYKETLISIDRIYLFEESSIVVITEEEMNKIERR